MSLGISNAWTLQQGYSVQYALNVSVPSTIAIGYNVSNIAVLSVMSSSQYGSYLNGSSVYPLYNSTVSGQDIKTISLPAGSYYAILDAKYATINYSYSAFAAPAGSIQSILVNTKYSLPLDLQNYSDINLSFVSDHPLKVYLPGGYNYTINGSVLYWNFHENRGQNYINFTSLQATRVFLLLNATPAIIDPLRYNMTNFTNPQPIGIASYGLYNYSGQFTPYQINTTEIEGTANITEISAYNAMPPVNVSKYGASLQLNALMNIESNGKRYTYWLQNIMSLNTSNMSYYIYDNVWNYSGSRANISNSTLSGNGWISST
ncbi:MAG: thermopsin family protease, partial [Candidatus Micrarchaeota archaeon]|nr:thermopsin family protease [Candidatus Micrarchaeota archaeon]